MKYYCNIKIFVAKTGFEPASPRLQTGPLQKPISVLRVVRSIRESNPSSYIR